MSTSDPIGASRRRRPPPRRRRRRRRRGGPALLVLLAVAFVLGIGLGEALHDNPDAGGAQTLVRTLHPLSLAPLTRGTVTVTTSTP